MEIILHCRAKEILSSEKVTENPVCSTLSVSNVLKSMEPPSESPTFTTRPHPAGWEHRLILVLSKTKVFTPPLSDGICHLVSSYMAKGLLPRWPVAFLRGGTDAFLKSTKTELRRGRWDEGCLYPHGIHQEGCTMVIVSTVGSSNSTKGSTPILRLSLYLSPSSSSTSAFPLSSHQTQVWRWQHANPALAGPLQCQFPPPGYMPLLIPCPSPPCAHPHRDSTGAYGVSWRSGWSLLEVTT